MRMRQAIRESDIQRACLDLLAVYRIFAIRLNTGAFGGVHNGKRRFVRFGRPGMADVLATPGSRVLWLEVKNANGRQSPEQKFFQQEVEAAGHSYLLVRDVAELERWLRQQGCI